MRIRKSVVETAVAVAVVAAMVAVALAIYSLPIDSDGSRPSLETTLAGTSFAETTASTFQSASRSGVAPAPWYAGQVLRLVFNSTVVQSLVGNAYSYKVVSLESPATDPNLIAVNITVVGGQAASGNLTTGYAISYSGNRSVYAVVRFTPPSGYELDGVDVTNYPAVKQSITFSQEEQQVAQVALSNSTVKSMIGAMTFYVAGVESIPVQSSNFPGDFLVSLNQVNGARAMEVYVNGEMTTATSIYQYSRTQTTCYSLGPTEGEECFTDPWSNPHPIAF
jgi:hypothetical protein